MLLNLGYHADILKEISSITGYIILPVHNYSNRIIENTVSKTIKIIDPQLYLSDLDPSLCSNSCARLASYPWFQIRNVLPYDSKSSNLREWKEDIKANVSKNWNSKLPSNIESSLLSAFQFQLICNCSHLLLPTPRITNIADGFQELCVWIDKGIDIYNNEKYNKTLYVSLCIDEAILNSNIFENDIYLKSLVDQISSRDEIKGVYLTIMQNNISHPFDTKKNVLEAYIYFTHFFSVCGLYTIINYADVFGYACSLIQNTLFSVGPSFPLRYLSKSNYKDESFGFALPNLFSSKTFGEYRSQRDLDKLRDKDLLLRVKDISTYSKELFDELKHKGSAKNLPNWVESRNRTRFSKRHFIESLINSNNILQKREDKTEFIIDHLETAIANSIYINSKFNKDEISWKDAPVEIWLELIKKYVA